MNLVVFNFVFGFDTIPRTFLFFSFESILCLELG